MTGNHLSSFPVPFTHPFDHSSTLPTTNSHIHPFFFHPTSPQTFMSTAHLSGIVMREKVLSYTLTSMETSFLVVFTEAGSEFSWVLLWFFWIFEACPGPGAGRALVLLTFWHMFILCGPQLAPCEAGKQNYCFLLHDR